MIAKYGVSEALVRQFARENDIPYFSENGRNITTYVFDEEAEKAFVNRNTRRGRPKLETKPNKEPAKIGRPRTRPIQEGPKRSVGRPPMDPEVKAAREANKRPRGRPRKDPAEKKAQGPKRPQGRPRKVQKDLF